jgi:REP element-mobilizing transposase RayT
VAAWRAERANPDMHPPFRSRAAIERGGCIGCVLRVPEYSRPIARNRRLDAAVYREPDRPVFVTVRAVGALAPFRDARLNDAVVAALLAQRLHCGCALYAHCLMPDHIHFVAAPGDDGDVCALIERFKSASTRIAWLYGRAGRLWQPRWYDHVVRHDESLVAICEYVLLNPVRARLVARSDDYPWCGQPDPIP